jgi:hypothetical protein
MSITYITFSGADYASTTEKIVADAPKHGARDVLVFDDVWLRESVFYEMPSNRWLWETDWRRGEGWFSWKPLIAFSEVTNHAMKQRDAVIIYSDADTYPIASLQPIWEIARRDGAMFFQAGDYQNRQWCKRDCAIVMGQDDDKYLDAPAGNAAMFAIHSMHWPAHQLLMEWLTYAVNRKANTLDASTIAPEKPGFIEHRAEQAIMTMLCHKYGFKLWRDPSQHGNDIDRDRDVYPQLFHHQEGMTKAPQEPRGSKWRNV